MQNNGPFRRFIEEDLDLSGLNPEPPPPIPDEFLIPPDEGFSEPPPFPDDLIFPPDEDYPEPPIENEIDLETMGMIEEITLKTVNALLSSPDVETNWSGAFSPKHSYLLNLLSGILTQYVHEALGHQIPQDVMQNLLSISNLVIFGVLHDLAEDETDDDEGISFSDN